MDSYEKEESFTIREVKLKEQDVVITYEINASALWNTENLGKHEIESFYSIVNSTHTWGSGKEFESDAWLGSYVTWKLVVVGNDGNDYSLKIDEIRFKKGESPFRWDTLKGRGKTRIRKRVKNDDPDLDDPEYTLSFTVIQEKTGDNPGGNKQFSIDPRIKVRRVHR